MFKIELYLRSNGEVRINSSSNVCDQIHTYLTFLSTNSVLELTSSEEKWELNYILIHSELLDRPACNLF
jgi:hypothetical protein